MVYNSPWVHVCIDDDKWSIRHRVWDYLEMENIAQNPRPVHNRIPNFVVRSNVPTGCLVILTALLNLSFSIWLIFSNTYACHNYLVCTTEKQFLLLIITQGFLDFFISPPIVGWLIAFVLCVWVCMHVCVCAQKSTFWSFHQNFIKSDSSVCELKISCDFGIMKLKIKVTAGSNDLEKHS